MDSQCLGSRGVAGEWGPQRQARGLLALVSLLFLALKGFLSTGVTSSDSHCKNPPVVEKQKCWCGGPQESSEAGGRGGLVSRKCNRSEMRDFFGDCYLYNLKFIIFIYSIIVFKEE